MKRVITIYALILIGTSAFAQGNEEGEFRTIFNNNGSISYGGYGAVTTSYAQVADRDAIMIGGHGAWLINHSLGIGISGAGFMTERETDATLGGRHWFTGGYGGLRLEYILMPHSPVHLSIPFVVGAGGVSYSKINEDINRPFDTDNFGPVSSEAFFVFEPGIELEFNVIKRLRIAFGATYRFTSDVDMYYANTAQRIAGDDLMKGFSGNISFKFGKF